MKRFSGRILAVVAATVIVAMAAQMAVAQNEGRRGRGGRGGGPGGPGGMMGPAPMPRLATIDTVQEARKVTDKQKDEIKNLNDEVRKEVMKEIDGGGRPDREKMKEIMDKANKDLNNILDSGQQKRLLGVFLQVNGAGALMDRSVEKELALTDEQRDKIHELMGPPPGEGRGEGRRRGEGRGEGKGDGEAKGEGRGERGQGGGFREQMEKRNKEIMAVLTSDQQKKLDELKGEKVEVDMSKLRGPGGPRGGRDRGNRGEPKESKDN